MAGSSTKIIANHDTNRSGRSSRPRRVAPRDHTPAHPCLEHRSVLTGCRLNAVIVLSTHTHLGFRRNPWERAVRRIGEAGRNTGGVTRNPLNLLHVFLANSAGYQIGVRFSKRGMGVPVVARARQGILGTVWQGQQPAVWRVEPKAAPGGRDGRICGMSDGGIDTVAGRAVEPPWRLKRTAGRSRLREAVMNEVRAGSAGAPAQVPGVVRPAVRGSRCSGNGFLFRIAGGCRCTFGKRRAPVSDMEAERLRRRRAQRDGRRTRRSRDERGAKRARAVGRWS